jgi:chemotaxis protein CheD
MTTTFSGPAVQENDSIVIGMGEYSISSSTNTILTCIGLGSCIAICVYDRLAKVGGMVHVVLPCHDKMNDTNQARYADTAVPFLINEVVKNGGARNRLTVKISGGAQMTHASGLRDTFKTGERNLAEIKAALDREKITLAASNTGGTVGRTVKMYIDSGKVTVKTVGGEVNEL